MTSHISLHDAPAPTHRLGWNLTEEDNSIVLAHSQDIPQSWSDWLAAEKRAAWDNRNKTEHIRVASVPAIFIHKWLMEGYDAYNEPVEATVKRLRDQDLTDFLATEKRVF